MPIRACCPRLRGDWKCEETPGFPVPSPSEGRLEMSKPRIVADHGSAYNVLGDLSLVFPASCVNARFTRTRSTRRPNTDFP